MRKLFRGLRWPLVLLLLALVMGGTVFSLSGCDSEEPETDMEVELEYWSSDRINLNYPDGYYVVGFATAPTAKGRLTIPAEYNGKPVVGVVSPGSNGIIPFAGNEFITSVVFSEGMVTCNGNAFSECKNLKSLSFPSTATEISVGIRCDNLKTLTVAEGNPKYHSDGNCIINTELKQVVAGTAASKIPSDGSVTSIGHDAFEFCVGLEKITIPDTVTEIGYCAFEGCTALKKVTLGDGVVTIGSSAFSECTALKSVNIPDSVTRVENMAFNQCKKLLGRSKKGVYYVDDWAIQCDGNMPADTTFKSGTRGIADGFGRFMESDVVSIELPGSVKYIGENAFSGSALTKVSLPEGLNSIGRYAFESCHDLEEITIPTSVTDIGSCAFRYDSKLTEIAIPASVTSIGTRAFAECSSLNEVHLSEGLLEIGEGAFQNCTGLAEINIPASVTYIGEGALSYCPALSKITVDPANEVYVSDNNCIVHTEEKLLVAACSDGFPVNTTICKVGAYVFSGLDDQFTRIDIPASVDEIHTGAFCSDFLVVFYDGTKEEWLELWDDDDKSVSHVNVVPLQKSEQ